MQYLGLAGKKRVGKDTFANIVDDGSSVATFSFAEPIYAMLESAFGSLPRIGDGFEVDKDAVIPAAGKTVRELLQTLGTDWGRELVNNNVWVNIMEDYLSMRLAEGNLTPDYVIFTDVRFDNEAALVKKLGGTVIEIRNDNAPKGDKHASEAGVTPSLIDYVLHNNGSMSKYRSAIHRLMKKL